MDEHGDPCPGDPGLGSARQRSLISAARAIGNFRRCVMGDWGSAVSCAECITRDAGAPEGIDGLSRVVNTTARR